MTTTTRPRPLLTGFFITTTRNAQPSRLWFNKIDEALGALAVIRANGGDIDLNSVQAEQCSLIGDKFHWELRPEWTAKVREAIAKEFKL